MTMNAISGEIMTACCVWCSACTAQTFNDTLNVNVLSDLSVYNPQLNNNEQWEIPTEKD